jgi:hypothetical protein
LHPRRVKTQPEKYQLLGVVLVEVTVVAKVTDAVVEVKVAIIRKNS